MNRIICGVDVSKDWLDAHVWPSGAIERFANDATGIAALWLFCRSHGAAVAVMEASGGYERLGFMLLWAHGMPCALVNARSVRRFAARVRSTIAHDPRRTQCSPVNTGL